MRCFSFDDQYFDNARKLDVDHLVPLSEAWDSGACGWTAKEREAYANDLDDERALIAVSAASDRSKADQDPRTWLPPYAVYLCRAALSEALSRCPNEPITVTLAW
ncbi:DUF1524 domain-containing protein [Streptomyces dysideae]|uniref:DUF1524 domain-containing protein n=1 Tax=Streptomyces dysideae TaxID=909626 RepID=A0A117RX33_9ACTN|nr:hypothetical protein AQJ91_47165 [Streptomyces dysideae]